MAKDLNTILGKYKKLEGVKASTIKPLEMGGYDPKAKGELAFVRQHSVEKFEDRAGNKDDVYKGTTKPSNYPVRTNENTNPKFIKMIECLEYLSSNGPKNVKFKNGEIITVDEETSLNIKEVFSLLDEDNKEKFINVAFNSYDDYKAISKLKED